VARFALARALSRRCQVSWPESTPTPAWPGSPNRVISCRANRCPGREKS